MGLKPPAKGSLAHEAVGRQISHPQAPQQAASESFAPRGGATKEDLSATPIPPTLHGADQDVATPLWAKCESEAHTPKSGNLESSETPENLELKLKGQNTLHWGVLGVIRKVLTCRCLKWPRIGHLDICSPSYGQKKGRESWQFDSRPLKVWNRPPPNVCSGSATRR
jgi:hypothetical protein